jgi:hypothetical protein
MDRGRRVIRLGAIKATVIQVGRRAYIRANGLAIVKFFGLPKKYRSQLQDRWLQLTPQDDNYDVVSEGVTLTSAIKDLIPVAPYTRTETTINGQQAVAISGDAPPSSAPPPGTKITLYLSSNSNPLPIRETGTAPGGLSETIDVSHWGEAVTVKAPKHALLESQFTGTAPSAA